MYCYNKNKIQHNKMTYTAKCNLFLFKLSKINLEKVFI